MLLTEITCLDCEGEGTYQVSWYATGVNIVVCERCDGRGYVVKIEDEENQTTREEEEKITR